MFYNISRSFRFVKGIIAQNTEVAREVLAELQWKQGWYDRLATASLTTGVYSLIELLYYLQRIYRIPVINWNSE